MQRINAIAGLSESQAGEPANDNTFCPTQEYVLEVEHLIRRSSWRGADSNWAIRPLSPAEMALGILVGVAAFASFAAAICPVKLADEADIQLVENVHVVRKGNRLPIFKPAAMLFAEGQAELAKEALSRAYAVAEFRGSIVDPSYVVARVAEADPGK
jgi:hypothetical protein